MKSCVKTDKIPFMRLFNQAVSRISIGFHGMLLSAFSLWYDTCVIAVRRDFDGVSKNMANPVDSNPYASLKPVTQIMTNPHFEAIGGEEPIVRLVERFYFYMDTLPEAADIRALHEPDLGHTKQVLVKFLMEWLGGPKVYSAERGHPRLRQKHMTFPVGEAARDAWMLCMRHAMEDVVTDAALRQKLDQAFFKTADFIRNDRGSNHA
jgi:hemoglobin